MIPKIKLNTEDFFANLDSAFVDIEKKNEPILFKTTDFVLQWNFELPIFVKSGSTIEYEFTTQVGDISFEIQFLSTDRLADIVFEEERVPSDIKPIQGTFKAQRDGTFLFVWNNSYSWFNSKLLSYKIELYQPAL